MDEFVNGQRVKLPTGGIGVIAEINKRSREVRCVIEPEKPSDGPYRGGATPAEWFKFAEVTPVT